MARVKPRLQTAAEYAAARLLYSTVRRLPLDWSRRLCRGLLWGILFMMRKRRQIVRQNMALAFPRSDPAQRRRIFQESIDHLARGLALYPRLPDLAREGLDAWVTIEGSSHLDDALRQGRGVLSFTGHYGFWEVLPIAMALRYPRVAVAGRPLDNPRLDRMVLEVRRSGGGEVIPTRRLLRQGLKHLRAGGILGIVIDQNFPSGGVFVDFFGRPAATTPIVPLLARRMGCPVLPMHTRWDNGKVRIICEPPIRLSENADPEKAIIEDIQTMTRALESWIRSDPGQWFWLHNRWKRRPLPGEWQTAPDWAPEK